MVLSGGAQIQEENLFYRGKVQVGTCLVEAEGREREGFVSALLESHAGGMGGW